MDGSEQREGRKLRIAMLGSRGIPHTYSGYEIFPCWNLRAARSVASGRGDRKYGRNASCRECKKEPLRAYEVNALGHGTWL